MKASHKKITTLVGFQRVTLLPGQFIFGRRKSSQECGISERSIRTCLTTLSRMENLTIKPTNRYSIITIVNWETYQQNEFESDQQNDQQTTSKRPTNDQQTTTNKNDKNDKNDKKKERESRNGVPDWIKKETWDDFREFRIRIKAPLTDRAVKGIITSLEKLRSQGHDPDAVLEQSIVRGWRGVFPIKSANKDDCPGFDWSTP